MNGEDTSFLACLARQTIAWIVLVDHCGIRGRYVCSLRFSSASVADRHGPRPSESSAKPSRSTGANRLLSRGTHECKRKFVRESLDHPRPHGVL